MGAIGFYNVYAGLVSFADQMAAGALAGFYTMWDTGLF